MDDRSIIVYRNRQEQFWDSDEGYAMMGYIGVAILVVVGLLALYNHFFGEGRRRGR